MTRTLLIPAAICAAMALSGCSNGLFRGSSPDEFAVVSKAPLVVPPEYNLLPPRPGEPRPQEIDSAAVAQQALFGQRPTSAQSAGEQTLVAQAGGLSADPAVRAQIERESAGVVYKDRSFTDRILGFAGGDDADLSGDPLDPEQEVERLERELSGAEVIGRGEVEIEQRRSGGIKLPGL